MTVPLRGADQIAKPILFSREVVRTWVSFYKKHREVLGADLVHVRRPNMQVGVKRNKKSQNLDFFVGLIINQKKTS